jgi:type IV secretion system protein VirB10
MTNPPNAGQAREQAVRDWERETDSAAGAGRQFSGERLKRVVSGDWLTKIGFVVGTAAVLYFILAHDGKEQKAQKKEARAVAQVEEPSVRDFRPPVMPAGLAAALPGANVPRNGSKSAGNNDSEAAAKRRKDDQLEEARTKSNIIVKGTAATAASASPSTTTAASAQPSAGIAGSALASLLGARSNEGPSDPNRQFADKMSGRAVPVAVPRRVAGLDCVALQGKMIDAELETAINTDLPGQIRAIVSSPLYAEQGTDPLVTPGSRLNGIYNTAVRKGQVRVFAIWNRLIRPDGTEITLDSGVTDALGRAGLEGETDNHFAQIFGMSALLSIIGAGAGTYGISPEAQFNSADAYRREVQQSFGRTSDRVLEPYVNVPPTTTVRQGERIKVFLNRDLDFCGLKSAEREQTELVLP